MENNRVLWTAPEYENHFRGNDWYWAFGIIVISSIVGSILVHDYLFAIFIAIACGTILVFHHREPELIEFEIFEGGVRAKDTTFNFSKLNSYWIHEDDRGAKLLLHSKREIMPLIILPLDENSIEEADVILSDHLKKEELQESHSHKIMDYLGF